MQAGIPADMPFCPDLEVAGQPFGARVHIPRLPGCQSICQLADLDQLEAVTAFSSGFLQWL